MKCLTLLAQGKAVLSPPARVVWIEMFFLFRKNFREVSPPARVVWIEMILMQLPKRRKKVATREGGVD